MSNIRHRENLPPEPVSPENPLVGLEVLVLKAWLENSRRLRRAAQQPFNRHRIESAVRGAVEAQRVAELQARAAGLSLEQAKDLTAPAMWTPPTWPLTPSKATPTLAAKPHAGSASTRPTPSPKGDGRGSSMTTSVH